MGPAPPPQIPNPQSPIPNPQSPIYNKIFLILFIKNNNIILVYLKLNNLIKNNYLFMKNNLNEL